VNERNPALPARSRQAGLTILIISIKFKNYKYFHFLDFAAKDRYYFDRLIKNDAGNL